jgi:hypothetical protein
MVRVGRYHTRMGDAGDTQRNTPDPMLGGLDEDVRRARAVADDGARPVEDRRVAAAYALAVTSAVRVLTGRSLLDPPGLP